MRGYGSHAVCAFSTDAWVNAVQPVPTSACVVCKAKLTKQEGRKMFMEATLGDVQGQPHYVDSTALFINLKPNADSIVKDAEGASPLGDLQIREQKADKETWNDAPRYQNLCKDVGL